ncbi:hypothetical protein [Paenibacillus sp. NPDC057934]|uniref:hypothetical protein n=1 Tax=Paenibacillus sp. NPDC057934 TaxID=3346282 RepID=UPI0036D853C3
MESIVNHSISDAEEIVVDYFGFKLNNTQKLKNYNNTIDSIDLGPIFEEVCDYLEINSDSLGRAVKEHALHTLYEEAITFSKEELEFIKANNKIWSFNISSIVENEYFEDPNAFFEYYTEKYLCDLFGVKYSSTEELEIERDRIRADLMKGFFPKMPNTKKGFSDKEKNSDEIWHEYSKKSGSLYRVVFKRKFNTGEMTLTRQTGRIVNKTEKRDDSKVFFKNAIESTDLFLKKLLDQASEHELKEELRMFEKDTAMFLIFDVVHKIMNSNKQSKYNKKGLELVSSFTLIDDFKIREVFLSAFHKEDGPLIKYLYRQGYDYFFLLNFILIPFLIKFLRNKLYSQVSSLEDSKLKRCGVDPSSYDDLKRLHIKLSLNKLIRRPRRETLNSKIKMMEDIRTLAANENSKEIFMGLYSEVKSVRSRVNRNKNNRQDFISLTESVSIKWMKDNVEELRKDTANRIWWLAESMANDFIEITGLYADRKEKRITFKELVKSVDAYFSQISIENLADEYTKFLNEIRSKGWRI